MQHSTRFEVGPWLATAIIAIALALFGLAVCAKASGQEVPLTHEQALAKIAEWGPDVTAQKIVVLDWMLREDPLVTMPMAVYALKGSDLWVGWDPAYIRVVFPTPLHGHPDPLDFKIPLAAQEKKAFVPGRSPWPMVGAILAAAGVSVAADSLLPLAPIEKQAAAFGLGAAAGLLAWLLIPS